MEATFRHGLAASVTLLALAGAAAARSADAEAVVDVLVETVAEPPLVGGLVALGPDGVTLRDGAGATRTVPLEQVRRVTRAGPAADAPPVGVEVACVDGARLTGSDFSWREGDAVIEHPAGPIALPIERVRCVTWRGGAQDGAPAWRAAVPEDPESDLVAVSRGDGFELVACAITGVTADTVTVNLDGEAIPVRRPKVLGLVWLRDAEPPAGVRVGLQGGTLPAGTLRWSPREFVVDGRVRLPPAAFASVDYAAGRTVPLVDLAPERLAVEPFFGSLATVPGMQPFFAPRTVAGEGDRRDLVVRPRTTAVWRMPPDSRRFRATARRTALGQGAGAVEIVLGVDDREVFRGRLGGGDGPEPATIDVDVAGGRRLSLTVDFGAGGVGCPVRLEAAAFER